MTNLFKSPPPPPALPPTPTMPDPQNPAVLDARRNAAMDMLSRASRSSTIMSTKKTRSEGNYGGKTLGNE